MSEHGRGNTAGRLCQLIEMAMQPFGFTMEDGMRELNVCRRSMHRYLRALEASGIVTKARRDSGGRWRYTAGDRLLKWRYVPEVFEDRSVFGEREA